jgi:hypothetical protein
MLEEGKQPLFDLVDKGKERNFNEEKINLHFALV